MLSEIGPLQPFSKDISDRFVPVTPQAHQTSSWGPFHDYGFARSYSCAPIVMAELHQIASTLPILFEDGALGPRPVALLKMGANGPHVVSGEGHWTAFFVPGSLRIHPFYTEPGASPSDADAADADAAQILVNATSAEFSTVPEKTRFYDVTGEPTPEWSALSTVLGNYAALQARTERVAKALEKGRLLVPARRLTAFDSPLFDDLRIIDRKALNALVPGRAAMLQSCGALELIHAHFTSLETLTQIKRLAEMRDKQPAAPAETSQAQDGFLDAMALAYENEGTSGTFEKDQT